MMAELIRTSLFCDIADMFMEELATDTTEAASLVEYILPSDNVPQTQPFKLRPTYSSNHAAGVALQVTTLPSKESPQIPSEANVPAIYSTNSASPPASTPFCNGSTLSNLICIQRRASIIKEAKVNISTFQNVAADEIFANDYLTQIKFNDKINGQKISHLIYHFGDVVVFRPPYLYSGLVIAAIYMSGKETVSSEDIHEELGNMFKVFEIKCGPWKNSWKKNVQKQLKESKYLYKNSDGQYGVKSVFVDFSVMKRKSIAPRGDNDKYAARLEDQLGVPTMMEDLKHGRRKRAALVEPSVTEDRKPEVTRKRKAADNACTDNDSPAKRTSLRLPSKPCFHDDNSTDEMFGSLDNTSETTQTDNIVKSPENDSGYEEFKQCLVTAAQNVIAPKSLPPVTTLIPIWNANIVQLVDMFVNGQLVRVPVQFNGRWL